MGKVSPSGVAPTLNTIKINVLFYNKLNTFFQLEETIAATSSDVWLWMLRQQQMKPVVATSWVTLSD